MYATVASRDRQPASRPAMIMNIPIKGKKQTKSQRKAAAKAQTEAAPQIVQWVEELLDDHVWQLVFGCMDVASLLQARLVCRYFRVVAESPTMWMAAHARTWGHGLPRSYTAFTWRDIRGLHGRRKALRVPVSTRAKTTLDPTTYSLTVLNNSMLRSFDRGTVDSVRSSGPLPPLPVLGQDGATYFEVHTTTYVSIGMVSLRDLRAYGFGSDAHVGWQPHSVGYHTHGPGLVYHDGNDMVESPGAFAHWSDRLFSAEAGDIVGVGYVPSLATVFFTLNGVHLGRAPCVLEGDGVAGAVSIHALDAHVSINWGAQPFAFAIEAYLATL
ncbi:hypothetical protein SDRG_05151 [Saprolegnia diclina VS20]|uniref:F-box domain-containing protein n=1 Tax=Saprolegnia diclina (strain VS20) TaxID=1156394 RepID=T0S4E4_SAPDV|nr:hypothetical protein SDRG_05151 [Saprolegnia diclina VS20]EQC37552.1 hypothetical protein SDRG_05151 [Saprolegnia diclina VS20]|eukprot:XP_008609072.1 hypothetical protein SDRG_05151 [Saprolegnia diclina VS20]